MAKNKFLILVSLRVDLVNNYNEYRDGLDNRYVKLLDSLGYDVVLLPNDNSDRDDILERLKPDGILLSGGNDISPERYKGNKLSSRNISKARDLTEEKMIRYGLKKGIPVLGICRGMQMINVFFGGSLFQDLNSRENSQISHVNTIHNITFAESFFIKKYQKKKVKVNSFHNQGILVPNLHQDLVPMAISDDGVIEALRHKSKTVYGIQWHPERTKRTSSLDKELIQYVFKRK
ncbi:gamma-glutamyl-gamma-aminobutyrate hydrolase family protein [Leptospira ilyithenensis]|uniref:Uncharacterized protein n=1 Tax=Leptospira ilyithenensis TaxID=2484901 RepID=A0A4R9LPW6_9LEPT|nr:type 1 glutamine amidotransferase [Leptospira ilyithenensis]TGN08010.1 hypothetical protein EHS11_13815 [Leptospira ilyithenensis]